MSRNKNINEVETENAVPNIKQTPPVSGQTSQATKGRQGSLQSPPASYFLLKEQSELFIEHLKGIRPPVRITVDGRNVSPHTPGNWYNSFAPISWGYKVSSGRGSGYGSHVGVAYGFTYTTNRVGSPFMRLAFGTESPFKHEFRDRFGKEVAEAVRSLNIPLPSGCHIWPDTKFPDFRFQGKSILECRPLPLGEDTWRKTLDNFRILNQGFNEFIARLVRKYYAEGAFGIEIRFD